MALLSQEGYVVKIFTQNVDGPEFAAGVPMDKVSASRNVPDPHKCLNCGETFPLIEILT
jgi:NAD-dependent SIR2 family protein deacetylase